MGFALWKKIKNGIRKVIGGIGKGAKAIWNTVIKPVGRALLPIAGKAIGSVANSYAPGSGLAVEGLANGLAGALGGNSPGTADIANQKLSQIQSSMNELIPRLKSKIYAGGSPMPPGYVIK
jgi:hypothetical protein